MRKLFGDERNCSKPAAGCGLTMVRCGLCKMQVVGARVWPWRLRNCVGDPYAGCSTSGATAFHGDHHRPRGWLTPTMCSRRCLSPSDGVLGGGDPEGYPSWTETDILHGSSIPAATLGRYAVWS